jgi:integrase
MSAAEPIRKESDVNTVASYFLNKKEYRNYLLVVMGINTALRISDLLRLRWCDVYDFKNGKSKTTLYLTEKKTGKSKTIALNHTIHRALQVSMENIGIACWEEMPLFARSGDHTAPISRIRAYEIIRRAGEKYGLRLSCHSLRKTFGYYAARNAVPLPLIMKIYNHSSVALTMRYLGITQDDQDKVYYDMAEFLPLNLADT